ncbi:MAG: glycosyltransferase [Putridiphycobacter sp.]|nr:glycosyltransferase [Putridiphycobacter sp.]
MAIKIIHIVLGKANPNKMNGINKVVNELATAQTKLGYEVTVWGITNSMRHNYPPRNYETRLFQNSGRFRQPTGFKHALSTLPVQTIFHIHGGFVPQFYFVAKLLLKEGFQYVYTPHGAYNAVALQRSKFKKLFFLKTFDKFLMKYAKRVHFIGQSEVDNGLKLFGTIPYSLIPNGQVPLSQPLNDFSQIEKTKPVFGFMGRIDIKTKGLDLLLEGFSKYVNNEHGKGDLWIIGSGEELAVLKSLARNLGIEDRIKFKGSLFGEAKKMALTEVNIFCLTSRNEGLPGVVLEASSFGIPSIVSSETNMATYINNFSAGWVLKTNAPNEITRALVAAEKVYYSDDFKQWQKQAYKMVTEKFNWANISKEHIIAYAT